MIVAGFKYHSVVDGEGFRNVVFLQGCPHRCEGCHNPESWDMYGAGIETSWQDVYNELVRGNVNRNVTISGGEPFLQDSELFMLLYHLKKADFNIWVYTGYTINQLYAKGFSPLLNRIDVLVDEKFDINLRDITDKIAFRGSSNQNIWKNLGNGAWKNVSGERIQR